VSIKTRSTLVFDAAIVDLDGLLKRLHLANARRNWESLVERAEIERWSCREFLGILACEEVAQRQQTRIQRVVHLARFPFLKTIDDFDFALQSSLRMQLLGSYITPELVSEGRNLILMGKSGRGNTHLAVAIAYRAIQNGFSASFVTAAALIEELSPPSSEWRLRETPATYLQPHVLVVDEVGYLSYGTDAANVLFHVVNERHLRRSPMLFTTNKSPLTIWGEVLHDHDLAEAIVDRVLEKGHLIVVDGPSYRTRHLQLDSSKEPGKDTEKISGKSTPKLLEPTAVSSKNNDVTGDSLPYQFI
jgi:DNA replication protein DnaC